MVRGRGRQGAQGERAGRAGGTQGKRAGQAGGTQGERTGRAGGDPQLQCRQGAPQGERTAWAGQAGAWARIKQWCDWCQP